MAGRPGARAGAPGARAPRSGGARQRQPGPAHARRREGARHARRGVRRAARRVRNLPPGEERVSRKKRAPGPVADLLAGVPGLSHVAIAVTDAEAYATRMVTALGAVRGDEELLDDGALKVVLVH